MNQTSRSFVVEQDEAVQIIVLPQNLSTLAGVDVLIQIDNLIADFKRNGVTQVVVDFGNVNYFGSIVLEGMLHLWKHLVAVNGKMALCNVCGVCREILSVSRFDTVWPIYATRAKAIELVRKSG